MRGESKGEGKDEREPGNAHQGLLYEAKGGDGNAERRGSDQWKMSII